MGKSTISMAIFNSFLLRNAPSSPSCRRAWTVEWRPWPAMPGTGSIAKWIFHHQKWWISPAKIVDFTSKNGEFTIKNGEFTIKNGEFTSKNGELVISPAKIVISPAKIEISPAKMKILPAKMFDLTWFSYLKFGIHRENCGMNKNTCKLDTPSRWSLYSHPN